MRPPWHVTSLEDQEVIRLVLEEPTMDLLRLDAEARGVQVEILIARLLAAAALRVDDLLGRP